MLASPISLSALVLLAISLPSRVCGRIDFCDGDPRILSTLHVCPSATDAPKRLLVYLPSLAVNPYHVMHDRIWALAYYLLRCTSGHEVSVSLARIDGINSSECLLDIPPQRSTVSIWSRCGIYFVSRLAGVRHENIHFRPAKPWWSPQPGQGCFEKTIALGTRPDKNDTEGKWRFGDFFRHISWYGRDCTSVAKARKPGQLEWECAGRTPLRNSQTLMELPYRFKKEAFKHIRRAFLAGARLEGEIDASIAVWQPPVGNTGRARPDRAVRVLLYGRDDAPRRIWANVGNTYGALKHDERLHVRWVQQMPRGWAAQIRLFRWADVVVSNHGAALANSVVMQEGAEVIEVVINCSWNVGQSRWRGKDWTGWHAPLINVGVSYVGCRKQYKGDRNVPVLVDQAEIMRMVDLAVPRQQQHMGRLGLNLRAVKELQVLRHRGVRAVAGAVAMLLGCWGVVFFGLGSSVLGVARR